MRWHRHDGIRFVFATDGRKDAREMEWRASELAIDRERESSRENDTNGKRQRRNAEQIHVGTYSSTRPRELVGQISKNGGKKWWVT